MDAKSYDKALVDAVAEREWERGRARGLFADMSWERFRRINAEKGGILDPVEKPLLANAREAIEAVLKHGTVVLRTEYDRKVKELRSALLPFAEAAEALEIAREALRRISDACPTTCDMTVAHGMAAVADEALARIEGAEG